MILINKTEEEKIVQNLEKDGISFHYQIKQIEQINIRRINAITKITGGFNLALIILFITGLMPFKVLFVISIIGLTILVRKSLIFDSEISNKINSLKSHMRSQEIHKVTENKFLREYYGLDDIKSDKGEKMLKDNALGKYKKKK